MPRVFAAIDFETADYGRDSACAVGIVRVEGTRIVAREKRLIRPPRRHFVFTYIHGITWPDVASAPTFRAVWRDVKPLLVGAEFIAAHSAGFDSSVLRACCQRSGLRPPDLRFRCTMWLARKAWKLRPTTLPDVCSHLGIRLKHHEPLSDATAAARIVLRARKDGYDLTG